VSDKGRPVFDASAVLALMQNETGAGRLDRVRSALYHVARSSIPEVDAAPVLSYARNLADTWQAVLRHRETWKR
jgi:PIN domain nuclease of toxin-antitoxin system